MTPATREEFIAYCKRRIGGGKIKINVTDEQIDDRVDEALKYFADYHFDGTEKKYFKHQVTLNDKANGYVTIPESIIGISNVMPIADMFVSNNFFNIRYQYMLYNINDITSANITPYYIAKQYLELLEEIFVGKTMFRYNRHENKCYIDIDWNRIAVGQYLVFEVYEALDPEVYTNLWGDRWLAHYACALIKRQWGDNLRKFVGVKLPGMIDFNGDKMYEDADAEIMRLEEEMLSRYSTTVGFYVS